MKRLFIATFALSTAAACSGTPDDAEIALGVFDRARLLASRYQDAIDPYEPLQFEKVASELKALAGRNLDVLLAGLASEDPDRRIYAAFVLGFSNSRAAIVPLTTAAGDNEKVIQVRVNAIASLGTLGLKEVPLDPFMKLLKEEDASLRVAALFGLRPVVDDKTEKPELLELVHEQLSHAVMDVRNEAVILLAKLRRPESVDVILARPVRDEHAKVRANAAATLGIMEKDALKANPNLIEMLRDDVTQVVEYAALALNRINEKDFDRSYHTWRDWYEDEQKHVYVCVEHHRVLRFVCPRHRAGGAQPAPGKCPTCRRELERVDGPGDCPICRRKLDRVLRETPRKSDTAYACTDHPEIVTTTAGKCGRGGCGKELVPRKPEAATHVCPDHAEVVTTTPGRCGKPGCKKDLVVKKAEPVTFSCPDHPEVVTTTPGKCGKPGCAKDLVSKK